MPHILSTKLDTTLRYLAGKYGLAPAVLSDIASAIASAAAADAKAVTADAKAVTAQAAAATADGKAVTAQTAAATADAKAVTAQAAAATAQTAAATADGKAVTAQAAAAAADAKAVTADAKAVTADGKAVTAQTDLAAHAASAGTAHPVANGSNAGFMSAAHFTKVQGVQDGAQACNESNVRAALAGATAAIAVNGQKLSGLADPTSPQDAVTKAYADAIATGLDVKASVRVIDLAGATPNGIQTVDGVVLAHGDRVLRAAGTSTAAGVYTVNSSGAWPRASDFDSNAEVTAGAFLFVTEGTHAGKGFVLVTPDPIVVGTTPLQFTQFSEAGATPLATESSNGLMPSTAVSKLATLAPGGLAILGQVSAQSIQVALGTPVPYNANVSLNPGTANDRAIAPLTGNIVITLSDPSPGQQGMIVVKQDAVGGRTVTFAASGSGEPATIMRDSNTPNLQANPAANAYTIYTYAAVTVTNDEVILFIGKLTPVAV